MRRTSFARRKLVVAATAMAMAAGGAAASASFTAPVPLPVVDPTVAPDRAVEPVVMTGADFPGIAMPCRYRAAA
jgi:hypothetical protein